ncbi:sugar kinase [Paenibacillus glycanilyticus]|uniref:2-dehydro-3-deoxygluconokinase n=1 Tax=Paenibacillus glycanilyticus TaxID=126569 RepID=A0ABQ6GHK6_9BACL|nr:sugar kinase [Paenibacillus glycanilyticus]GLX69755.1 2-dehydro-3-deoxygluconokinase [Paenibacillus glycanilyticus]
MPNRIVAFGEIMMRLQVPGVELLTQSNTLQYSFSGTGVNVAAALSHLGHHSYIVSTLPDNPLGDAAIAHLRKLGLATELIRRDGQYIGMYFLESGFGARPSRVTYTNRQQSSFNTAALNGYDFAAASSKIDAAHFCGITLAMNDTVRAQMVAFAHAVRIAGGKVSFDCNYRPGLWGEGSHAFARTHYESMLELADMVFMNEKDAMLTLGMQTNYAQCREQLLELIPKVALKYSIQTIAGTHRTINKDNTHTLQGYLFKDGRFTFGEPLTFAVHDRIGTGDAFASGIIHGQLKGWVPEETIAFASAASMLAHTITGDTPLSSESDIRKAMATSLGDIER